MKVKDIVKLCGELLNYDFDVRIFEEDVKNEYIEQALASDKNLRLLTKCVGLVEAELACDYFPLRATQTFAENVAKISQFEKPLHEATKVLDGRETEVDFVNTPLQIVANTKGGVKVYYNYRPSPKGFCDTLERGNPKMDDRLFSYGAIAEFMFLTGMYEEAAMWDKRYKDLIQVASVANKSHSIPLRRWA